MNWLEACEQAAERAHTRRVEDAIGDPAPGIDPELWQRLCQAIDASVWLTGRLLAPRDIRDIAHAAAAVLRPPTPPGACDSLRASGGLPTATTTP